MTTDLLNALNDAVNIINAVLADERKRREPVRMPVSRLEPVDYGEPIDDPDSRIVHGAPVVADGVFKAAIAKYNSEHPNYDTYTLNAFSSGWIAHRDLPDPRDALLSQAREALWTLLQGDEMGEGECQRTGFPRMIERHEGARASIAAIDKYKEATHG